MTVSKELPFSHNISPSNERKDWNSDSSYVGRLSLRKQISFSSDYMSNHVSGKKRTQAMMWQWWAGPRMLMFCACFLPSTYIKVLYQDPKDGPWGALFKYVPLCSVAVLSKTSLLLFNWPTWDEWQNLTCYDCQGPSFELS